MSTETTETTVDEAGRLRRKPRASGEVYLDLDGRRASVSWYTSGVEFGGEVGPEVNWSALGSVSLPHARLYSQAIAAASHLAEVGAELELRKFYLLAPQDGVGTTGRVLREVRLDKVTWWRARGWMVAERRS